jgi:hypothetical protein
MATPLNRSTIADYKSLVFLGCIDELNFRSLMGAFRIEILRKGVQIN